MTNFCCDTLVMCLTERLAYIVFDVGGIGNVFVFVFSQFLTRFMEVQTYTSTFAWQK